MHLSRIISVLSFFGALTIGSAVGYFTGNRSEVIEAVDEPRVVSVSIIAKASVPARAQDLRGVWKGTWGYDRADCTLEIGRIEGQKFSGTLKKGKAKIAIEGTIDTVARTIFFREIKVLDYGDYEGWSLGTNHGTFSPDARTLTGTGIDKYGTYGWDVSAD